jgi:hypothetical protein
VGRTQQKSVPPPKPGEFYVNDQAMKYRCLKVEGNKITWMLLDSRQNGHVIDATYVQDIEHAHYYSPLNNPAEAARLEQRYQRLLKNSAK